MSLKPFIQLQGKTAQERRAEWRQWKKLGYRVAEPDGITIFHEKEAIRRLVLEAFKNIDADVFLFGSQVSGAADPYSDYDVGYNTNMPVQGSILATLKHELEELPIPGKQNMQAQRLNQVSSTIEAQQNKEEEKLNQVMEEYRQFLAQPRSVKQLNAELEAKVQLLTDFKTNLSKTQVELEGTRRALEAAEKELAETPTTLKTVKVVGDDPLLLNITESKTGRPSQEVAGLKLEDEEPNPIYLSLATQANTYRMQVAQLQEKIASLQEQIRKTEKELQELHGELAEKQLIDDKYQVQIKNLQENYRSLMVRSEDARVAGSLDTSVQTRLIAPAVAPTSPVKPRKLLNTAIAVVLGLMVGVFTAFFLEAWNAPVYRKGEIVE